MRIAKSSEKERERKSLEFCMDIFLYRYSAYVIFYVLAFKIILVINYNWQIYHGLLSMKKILDSAIHVLLYILNSKEIDKSHIN